MAGGSSDATGDPKQGWVTRGERMLNRQTHENFWDIFGSVPSLDREGMSVTDEIFSFSEERPLLCQGAFPRRDRRDHGRLKLRA